MNDFIISHTESSNQHLTSWFGNLKSNLIIKPMHWLFYNDQYDLKLFKMSQMPKGTIGKDIADMLIKGNMKLIPKFENHDLKHLILGFQMTPTDEVKMQAYLFGNGNRTIFCILPLLTGIFHPSLWEEYYQAYKNGKKAPCILNLSIEECIHQNTSDIIKQYR